MPEGFQTYKPHMVITISTLSISIFTILLQTLLSQGISAAILVVYEHFIATVLLYSLALYLEKGEKATAIVSDTCWAFLLGLLHITLSHFLFTSSLRYITATVQSISLNTSPVVTFVLAVFFQQEAFHFGFANGQAKLLGIMISAGGARTLVVWVGPAVVEPTPILFVTQFSMDICHYEEQSIPLETMALSLAWVGALLVLAKPT